ncbi:hypothetical protein [Streptomyces sp. G-G2]|uniref:hypothetical protein n=1 Tax=Streptomyces sp. G-G2 TaxID=3046201 RepID=UPI0024BBEA16|nr:hypothetical protein [Streptomyces sp. G-G2]MDJ0380321.1 hypothetical protein [Streptomyces sp. G-G2]
MPPGRSRTGRVIAIVAVALAGVLVAGFAVNRLAGGGFPEAEYRLIPAATRASIARWVASRPLALPAR